LAGSDDAAVRAPSRAPSWSSIDCLTKMAAEAHAMSLARDVTTVGSATLVSRVLGFVRDVGIAAVLGTGVFADAFFAVLQLTNVFRRLLAEGALNAAFVPLWLRIKDAKG